jgi:putative hydrolase of the HAD superfamily
MWYLFTIGKSGFFYLNRVLTFFHVSLFLTIKAITFDFWATLYQSKTIDYTKRLFRLKEAVEQYSGDTFEPEQFQAAVSVARETWGQTWREEYRTLTASEWLGIMLNELGISLAPAHLFEIKTSLENSVLADLPTPVPEARTVLSDLSASYQLAIISDTGLTPGRVLCKVLEKDNLIDYFAHLTFSDEVGRSKPHPQVFLTTLDALGVRPQEAVHVGDLLRTDIAGAQRVGMRAVQYIGVSQDTGATLPTLSEKIIPEGVIKNLAELAPMLQRWHGDTGN